MIIEMKDLRQRALSAIIAAPVVLLTVYAGGLFYSMVVAVIALVALWEWLRLVDSKAEGDVVFLSYATLLLIMGMGAWQSPIAGALFGVALVTALYFLAVPDYKERARWIVLGLPYIAGFALALLYLRAVPPQTGRMLVYYLLAVVWGTDIGAYAVGRLVGGPKFVPAISPNKTWAGFFGGLALAAICGTGFALIFGARSIGVGFALALMLAVAAQLGDLFESWIKRRADVKQSSDLIPGHGGVLDRIDSLIFAAIVFAVFETLFGVGMEWW